MIVLASIFAAESSAPQIISSISIVLTGLLTLFGTIWVARTGKQEKISKEELDSINQFRKEQLEDRAYIQKVCLLLVDNGIDVPPRKIARKGGANEDSGETSDAAA